jgi:hypothetical protein
MSPFDSSYVGRLLIVVGVLVVVAGVILLAAGRLPLGRLPGDISWSRGNVSFFLPLGTSLVLSVVLTLILNLLFRR